MDVSAIHAVPDYVISCNHNNILSSGLQLESENDLKYFLSGCTSSSVSVPNFMIVWTGNLYFFKGFVKCYIVL